MWQISKKIKEAAFSPIFGLVYREQPQKVKCEIKSMVGRNSELKQDFKNIILQKLTETLVKTQALE